jgi:hypothetical protein
MMRKRGTRCQPGLNEPDVASLPYFVSVLGLRLRVAAIELASVPPFVPTCLQCVLSYCLGRT